MGSRSKLKRVYHAYTTWEDFSHGMYSGILNDEYIEIAVQLLSNPAEFELACMLIIKNWLICTENALTAQVGKKSWLGQAACCYKYDVPETCTREAWSRLSSQQQNEANSIAQKVINYYEENYKELRPILGGPMLY